MDKSLNLKLALKNPSNCSADELDEILDAQLHAVHYLHSMGITKESEAAPEVKPEKKSKQKQKALKRLKTKV
jgi:hypothetical protein